MTVLPSPEAMIVVCTVILIAYTAHVLNKAFASSEQFEAMLKARERIMGLQAENDKLRELAKDMLSELRAATQYDAGGGQVVVYEFADRMRELGMEVQG